MAVPDAARVAEAVEVARPVAGSGARSLVYRLLLVELARQRGVRVDPTRAAGPVRGAVEHDVVVGILELLRTEAPTSQAGDDAQALGDLHQRLLDPSARRASGSWFTPPALVEHLLDLALEPVLEEGDPARVTLCDPSCGSGLFLVAALRRFVRRGVDARHVVEHCLHGVDTDPDAVELAAVALRLAALTHDDAEPVQPSLRVGDALEPAGWSARHDVVVGNPPFLNRLERRTAPDRDAARRIRERGGGVVGPYTDVSAVFLHRAATSWVRRGGRVALVQPQSLLAARDAAGVRAAVAGTCSLEALWASDRPVFDAGVLTCAPVLRVGGAQGEVRRSQGPGCTSVAPARPGDLRGTWSHLLAGALGVPGLTWRRGTSKGCVGDLADCTADFRDQYYGLAGHVREVADLPDGVPLVTTGMVDPAASAWGRRPARFLKQRWTAPVVDVAALAADPALGRWARARLVPKVLVGTQGKVVEAVADERGEWLPSVPTITVVPHTASVWHLLAVLLAPPVSVHAATTYAGAGLTMSSIKLSARQVAALPLPLDAAAWDEAAEVARRAQQDAAGRATHLARLGELMCAAYDVVPDEVMPWWLARLR